MVDSEAAPKTVDGRFVGRGAGIAEREAGGCGGERGEEVEEEKSGRSADKDEPVHFDFVSTLW